MKKFFIGKKKVITILLIILAVVITSVYSITTIYSVIILSDYKEKTYPNTYINSYDISNINKKQISSRIRNLNTEYMNHPIIFIANGNEYTYKIGDLGISLDEEKLINSILNYDKNMSYTEKLNRILSNEKKFFNYEYKYSDEDLVNFFTNLKGKVDTSKTKGKLVMNTNRVLTYEKGKSSFSLDIDKNIELIKNKMYDLLNTNRIELIGKTSDTEYDILSTINTKISSYSTKFNQYVSRGRNLEQEARYLDGAIIYPNQVFSFYKYAGPYNKKGYVYYDGIMANGICQVASTMYNAELLAGLKTLERYSHADQMVYVKGGLDATVATTKTAIIDLKFKNIYEYPIYISAYTNGGTITIDFWSNDKALKGRTYELESVKIGTRGFNSYRRVYENGKLIERNFIATTWYIG